MNLLIIPFIDKVIKTPEEKVVNAPEFFINEVNFDNFVFEKESLQISPKEQFTDGITEVVNQVVFTEVKVVMFFKTGVVGSFICDIRSLFRFFIS